MRPPVDAGLSRTPGLHVPLEGTVLSSGRLRRSLCTSLFYLGLIMMNMNSSIKDSLEMLDDVVSCGGPPHPLENMSERLVGVGWRG